MALDGTFLKQKKDTVIWKRQLLYKTKFQRMPSSDEPQVIITDVHGAHAL